MKPRMLVLTPRFPYPIHGGDILRIYKMCERLREEWSLVLLSLTDDATVDQTFMPASAPFAEVHTVYLPRWRSYLQALGALVSGETLQMAYYSDRRFAAEVDRLASSCDAVLCHLLRTARYAQAFNGPRFLELTDHLPLTYERSSKLPGQAVFSLRRLAYRVEQARIERAQVAMAAAFDVVSFVSDVDRDLFVATAPDLQGRALTFRNGIDLPPSPAAPPAASANLVFVGNMHAMTNADAVRHFVASILPRIRIERPEVRLKLIGRMPERLRTELAGQIGIDVLGPVDSVAEACADAVVGVCPVRVGAGIQNKMLEYMACGLPSVTTPLGAEGLDGEDGGHYRVAPTDEAFAQAVLGLLSDERGRGDMGHAARQFVAERYGWRRCLDPMAEAYGRVLRDRPPVVA